MSGIENRNVKKLAGEFVVPAIMLVCVGAYWVEAASLSASAIAFPATLTAVVVGLVVVILAGAINRAGGPATDVAEEETGKPLDTQSFASRCFVVLLPAVLIFFWDWTGATLALFLYAAGVSFILRERRWFILVLLPAGLSIALVYLFKTLLYIRLPDALWAVGN
jgi:hypothetical protein